MFLKLKNKKKIFEKNAKTFLPTQYYDEDDYNDEESEEEDSNEINTDTGDEIEDSKTNHITNLSNYSTEYMQEVVDYADEKNSSINKMLLIIILIY